MNYYIKAQIAHIIAFTKSFNQSCAVAATENDGTISKSEAKTLKKIDKATQRFIKDLERISK